MSADIDYFYTSASPFSYLGHRAFLKVARRHNANVRYRPVNLMELWEVSGATPPAKRPPVRQRYRLVELQRIAEFRSLPIVLQPKFFPVDPELADRVTIAIARLGKDPSDFMSGVFSAIWTKNENIADETTLVSLLKETGFDPDQVLALARDAESASAREENTRLAIAADAVGVPTYVLKGEPFWGQDRIDFLDRALQSGREPIRVS